MTEVEKSIIRNASLEDILDLRVDVIPVSHYNQCATYKDKQIEELKERLRIESQSLHEQCEIVSKQVEQIEKMECCGNCNDWS